MYGYISFLDKDDLFWSYSFPDWNNFINEKYFSYFFKNISKVLLNILHWNFYPLSNKSKISPTFVSFKPMDVHKIPIKEPCKRVI